MTRVLKSERRAPHSGELRSIVVFLHGYGANAADLMGLADPLAEHLPDTLFVAPNAPEEIPGYAGGYQWFPIPWIDGSSEEESKLGRERAAADLDAFLDGVMVDEDLLPEQVMVLGFSQGTMMALHVAIVLGAAAIDALNAPLLFLIILVVGKTIADLTLHLKSHRG